MAKRNYNQFVKRQKEMERQKKASEKMAKRQGKSMRNEPVAESAGAEPAPDGNRNLIDTNPSPAEGGQ